MAVTKSKLLLVGFLASGAVLFNGSDSVTRVDDAPDTGEASSAEGTIDLSISPTTNLVTFVDFMPGDSTTKAVVVRNGADGESFRYSISSAADGTDSRGLEDQLVMIVRTGDDMAPAACDAFTGTPLYRGELESTDGRLVGDAAAGPDAGDRSLVPGTSETLCFRVSMPLSTGNSFQGSTTDLAITFTAEPTEPGL